MELDPAPRPWTRGVHIAAALLLAAPALTFVAIAMGPRVVDFEGRPALDLQSVVLGAGSIALNAVLAFLLVFTRRRWVAGLCIARSLIGGAIGIWEVMGARERAGEWTDQMMVGWVQVALVFALVALLMLPGTQRALVSAPTFPDVD